MGIPLPGEVILGRRAACRAPGAGHLPGLGRGCGHRRGRHRGQLGYLAGRRWGDGMFRPAGAALPQTGRPRSPRPYAEHIFTRYGVWAVFIGRFVALLRIFAGPVAGALRMPYPRFLAANALGGLVWACGTTAAVYALGTRAENCSRSRPGSAGAGGHRRHHRLHGVPATARARCDPPRRPDRVLAPRARGARLTGGAARPPRR